MPRAPHVWLSQSRSRALPGDGATSGGQLGRALRVSAAAATLGGARMRGAKPESATVACPEALSVGERVPAACVIPGKSQSTRALGGAEVSGSLAVPLYFPLRTRPLRRRELRPFILPCDFLTQATSISFGSLCPSRTTRNHIGDATRSRYENRNELEIGKDSEHHRQRHRSSPPSPVGASPKPTERGQQARSDRSARDRSRRGSTAGLQARRARARARGERHHHQHGDASSLSAARPEEPEALRRQGCRGSSERRDASGAAVAQRVDP